MGMCAVHKIPAPRYQPRLNSDRLQENEALSATLLRGAMIERLPCSESRFSLSILPFSANVGHEFHYTMLGPDIAMMMGEDKMHAAPTP